MQGLQVWDEHGKLILDTNHSTMTILGVITSAEIKKGVLDYHFQMNLSDVDIPCYISIPPMAFSNALGMVNIIKDKSNGVNVSLTGVTDTWQWLSKNWDFKIVIGLR